MVDNDTVREALVALEDENGCLTPQIVLNAAKRASSPLHECFEWNDSVAAQAWRIEQARTLIRSVKLVISIDEMKLSTVHYVRDPRLPGDEQGYVAIPNARRDKDLAQQIIRQEFARAEAAMQRAEEVAKALNLQHVLGRARKRIAKSAAEFERSLQQRAET